MMQRVLGLGMATLVAASMLGCGSEGGASLPAPTQPVTDASADSADGHAQGDAQSGADAATAMKRTVMWRDPFGNYAAGDNLVMDGDFEWSGAFAQQYPWFRSDAAAGMTAPAFGLGPKCRSGTKCAIVSQGQGIAGFGVRPPGQADHADLSVWARPQLASSCAVVSVSVGGCVLSTSESYALDGSGVEPDADGWCHFSGSVQMPDDTPCVFVSVAGPASATAAIDDVVMTAPGATRRLASSAAPSAGHMRVVERLRRVIRESLRPGAAAPRELPPGLRGRIQ